MKRKTLMLSIIKDGQIDCPQDDERIYFDDIKSARNVGIELLKEFDSKVFIVRLLTTGRGHFRTLGYFNSNNEYIR